MNSKRAREIARGQSADVPLRRFWEVENITKEVQDAC